jgi:hypothetical protein
LQIAKGKPWANILREPELKIEKIKQFFKYKKAIGEYQLP